MGITAFGCYRLYLALLGVLIWAPGRAAETAQANVGPANQVASEETLLTDKDPIVLTGFENHTGQTVFDDALKQKLAIELGQSPFLNVLSDRKVGEALRGMGLSSTQHITPPVGRELCVRTGSKAMIGGTLSTSSGGYLLELTAVDCTSGNILAQEQGKAGNKEAILKAMNRVASGLRTSLGETRA